MITRTCDKSRTFRGCGCEILACTEIRLDPNLVSIRHQAHASMESYSVEIFQRSPVQAYHNPNHQYVCILRHLRKSCVDRHYREVLLGITGKDYTLIAASKAAMRGATILKASDDKTRELNKHTLMAFSGEAGDTGNKSLQLFARCGANFLLSKFCRIHTSQRPALLDAERYRFRSIGRGPLRSGRARKQLKIKEAIHSKPVTGRDGPDHGEAQLILAGLSSGTGTFAICGTRLCSVSADPYPWTEQQGDLVKVRMG